MGYTTLEFFLDKANCSVEKNMTKEGDETLRVVEVFAHRTDTEDGKVKIMRISTTDKDATFDKIADNIMAVIVKSGVHLTVSMLAEKMEAHAKQSGLVDQDGTPMSLVK
jgi:hypothetical protein